MSIIVDIGFSREWWLLLRSAYDHVEVAGVIFFA